MEEMAGSSWEASRYSVVSEWPGNKAICSNIKLNVQYPRFRHFMRKKTFETFSLLSCHPKPSKMGSTLK